MENELYNITESEIAEFDQLYDGAIDEKDYYLLMARMELDEILKHKYTVYKLLRKEIELNGLANKVLKSRLKALDRERASRKRKKRIWIGITLSSFVVILMMAIHLLSPNTHELIYEKYRDSEAGLPLLMDKVDQTSIDSAMILIASGKYHEAYKTLDGIVKNDTVSYLKAFCLEQRGAFESASDQYKDLKKSESKMIKQKSEFRFALLYILLNKQESFKHMGLIAADSTHIYQDLAQEVMEELVK
jgi:tetratricopeptide (TPR) repeat protein